VYPGAAAKSSPVLVMTGTRPQTSRLPEATGKKGNNIHEGVKQFFTDFN
jgi:hypothetical protein